MVLASRGVVVSKLLSCFQPILVVLGLLMANSAQAYFQPFHLQCTTASSKLIWPVQQVFHATAATDLQYDPTQLSLLIAVAFKQRYGSTVAVRDIASLISSSHAGQSHSFLDIKRVFKAAGHAVSAYRLKDAQRQTLAADDVGFLIDPVVSAQGGIITLLFAAESDKKYLLYANGIVCPMQEQVFAARFAGSVFLRLD